MSTRRNLAGRVGAWSAHHPRTAIVGWLVVVLAALAIGSAVPRAELTAGDQLVGDSAEAARILRDAGMVDPAAETVLVQRRLGVAATDAAAAVTDLVQRLGATDHVDHVTSPSSRAGRGLVSRDHRSVLVTFEITGDPETAGDRVGPATRAVQAVAAAHPSLRVEQFGSASANRSLDAVMAADFHRAEVLSLPITLAVLLLAFGAVAAALLPLGFALTAFLAALGLLSLSSRLLPVDSSAQTVMLLIGLAVGVDYSLFYLKREREERARGASPRQALETAAGTAGRSVLISGVTVMVAMAGMFLTGSAVFTGIAAATILVVATSVVGSLTVLPAIMGLLGDRVETGRLRSPRHSHRSGGRLRAVLGVALRHPVAVTVTATAALVALALPALGLQLRNEGIDDLPRSSPVVATYHRLTDAFPGGQTPARVVVRAADVTSPQLREAVARLRTEALATGTMHDPVEVRVSADHTVAAISIPLEGSGEDSASVAALGQLHRLLPSTVGAVPGTTVKLGGPTAESEAFKDLMRHRTPVVFGFVLLLAFVLLLVSFRSVVVAATAIVLNLLGVAASYGALVLVFQHGVGASLIGLQQTGAIVNWVPLFLFVILFGLSMDYHVLILSRITEARLQHRTRDAIAEGIGSSAGVVTSAALIMVFVFLCFVGLSMTSMKQVGLGLAIAVLLDATVIRVLLLPGVMTLLGERNWLLPRGLGWVPSLPHEPAAHEAGAVSDPEPVRSVREPERA